MNSKELDIAIELLFGLKVKTLRIYAKSHNIKFGKNKAELIENIINSITSWSLRLEAIPGSDLTISFALTPDGDPHGPAFVRNARFEIETFERKGP